MDGCGFVYESAGGPGLPEIEHHLGDILGAEWSA